MYEHNIKYRWLVLLMLYISLLYVQISVQATLSGRTPGVTEVAFSVLSFSLR